MKIPKSARSRKPSAFIEWVNEYGGRRLAKVLGIDPSTISHWRGGRVLPKAEHMKKIVELSEGRVTYDHIIDGSAR